MSKFHSTVSRRDFMKVLGFGTAGLGAAAASAPVFHDLDEIIAAGDITSNPWANLKRPWWIKEREFKNPTTEIDWSIFEAWDHNHEATGTLGWHPSHNSYKPELCTDTALRQRLEQMLEKRAAVSADVNKRNKERLEAGTPGWALRDKALSTGGSLLRFAAGLSPLEPLGKAATPEQMGVPKWTGTPEEATNMLRAAAHMYGSPSASAIEFDSDTKKIFYPTFTEFADVDEPYEDTTRTCTSFYRRAKTMVVIPNKCQWGVYFPMRDTEEMNKRDHSSQTGISRYFNQPIILHRVQRFINALGYMAPIPCNGQGAGMPVAGGVLTGLGELNRASQQITPEWGPFAGMSGGLPTNLPLAPTKPIDAGIWKFCASCKICYEVCQAATGDSPMSSESEPSWEITGPWNRVGLKQYHHNWPKCGGCGVSNCMKVCPFATHSKGFASAHEFIKATAAVTPIFDGFFASMGRVFYDDPPRNEEDFAAWWDRDLNAWEYDTILGGGSGPNGGR